MNLVCSNFLCVLIWRNQKQMKVEITTVKDTKKNNNINCSSSSTCVSSKNNNSHKENSIETLTKQK
jgi:hypothetical protein